MQMGNYAADTIKARVEGRTPPGPFRYKDPGSMATIGRASAVVDLGWTTMTGYLGWLAWLFIHLIFLIGFRNKLSVLLNWIYAYFAYKGGARIIIGSRGRTESREPVGTVAKAAGS